jgi:16S rRNA (guanine527-N7)-methyltransferase
MTILNETTEISQNFSSLLSLHTRAIGVELDESQIRHFIEYLEELNLWNQRINLVSSDTAIDLLIKHFIDSLVALQFIPKPASQIIDIGSGAGFPGIPLKIAMPCLHFTLLEVSRKRGSFLKNVIRKLNLTNIEVLNKRVQDVMDSRNYLGAFDIVISRAAFKLPELVHIAGHFLERGGILMALKGVDIDLEVKEAETPAKSAGLTYVFCHQLILPLTGSLRKIIIYRKH